MLTFWPVARQEIRKKDILLHPNDVHFLDLVQRECVTLVLLQKRKYTFYCFSFFLPRNGTKKAASSLYFDLMCMCMVVKRQTTKEMSSHTHTFEGFKTTYVWLCVGERVLFTSFFLLFLSFPGVLARQRQREDTMVGI